MSAYFVTSTGTGVGKTFTTCALVHAARQAGRQVQAFKPIISGWENSLPLRGRLKQGISPVSGEGPYGAIDEINNGPHLTSPLKEKEFSSVNSPSDTQQIIAALGGGEVNSISPWRFAPPLSPHRAALLEKKEIALDDLLSWSRQHIAKPGLTLIEGVGGVMVPINHQHTVLDWMAALNITVILVVGSYLGTISHTLTALAALKSAGIAVKALVVSETPNSTVTLTETMLGLAPFISDYPLQCVQPIVSSWREATEIHALAEKLC